MKNEKQKIIEITFEDGEKWQIPLSHIAKHRTDYYANKAKEKDEEDDFNYQEDFDFVMEDDYEGIDWLQNNMDYTDFQDVVKIIKPDSPSQKDWANADSEIKEI